MAEVEHAETHSNTSYSNSSATYNDNGVSIPNTFFSADVNYLLVIFAGCGGSNAAQTEEFRMFKADSGASGGELLKSHANIEPRRVGSTTPVHYYGFWKHATTISTTPGEFRMEMRSNGTDNARMVQSNYMAFNLDTLGAANYDYDENNTLLNSLDSSAWTDGASVTVGDNATNFLICWCAHVLVNSTSQSIKARVLVDGVATDVYQIEGEDTAEEHCTGGQLYVANPGTAKVIKVQFQTTDASTGAMDVDRSAIFALQLDAFEDSAGIIDNGDTAQTVVDTDYIQTTLTHTTATVATEDWALWTHLAEDHDNSINETRHWAEDSNASGFETIGDSSVRYVSNGNTDVLPLSRLGYTSIADGIAVDVDSIANLRTISSSPASISGNIVIHTWELAEVIADFLPYHNQRPNTLLRM